MLYNPTTNTGILLPPRTGTQTLEHHALRHGYEVRGGRHARPKRVIEQCERIYCTTRNHFDAIASWWHKPGFDYMRADYAHAGPGPWFLDIWHDRYEQKHQALSTFFQYDTGKMWGKYTDLATELLEFADLEETIAAMFGEHAVHVGKSVDRIGIHYSAFFTDADAAILSDLFAAELAEYGYAFERKAEPMTYPTRHDVKCWKCAWIGWWTGDLAGMTGNCPRCHASGGMKRHP